MRRILPVILCGGSGQRLWPMSTEDKPKQFAKILPNQKRNLFSMAIERVEDVGVWDDPLVITGDRYVVQCLLSLQSLDRVPRFLLESKPRGTAAAILAATISGTMNRDQLLLFCPSDHLIAKKDVFMRDVQAGIPSALDGNIVTFGVKPNRPETGYGYIHAKNYVRDVHKKVFSVSHFVEKPNRERAEGMIADGDYLWNSGIFLATRGTIEAAFREFCPAQYNLIMMAHLNSTRNSIMSLIQIDPDLYDKVDMKSFDYEIMEKFPNIAVVSTDCGWSDVGSWESVWNLSEKSSKGISVRGKGSIIWRDCDQALLVHEGSEFQQLTVLGMEDIVVIVTKNDILISKLSESQKIRNFSEER